MDKVKEIHKLQDQLKDKFLSDQEIEEILQRIERLEMEKEESNEDNTITAKIQTTPNQNSPKRQKRSLYDILKEKFKKEPEEPATLAEIDQLKLEFMRAELKRRIAKAKIETPQKPSKLNQLLASIQSSEPQREHTTKSHKRRKSPSYHNTGRDVSKLLDKVSGRDDFKNRDFRKAFYG